MPTYDYHCPLCQGAAQVTQSINDTTPAPTCTNCKVALVRNYTAPGVTFLGTGWAHKDKGPRK